MVPVCGRWPLTRVIVSNGAAVIHVSGALFLSMFGAKAFLQPKPTMIERRQRNNPTRTRIRVLHDARLSKGS